ncbi:hypothetical protein [Escherichia coli]|nr:hypothetical protein [Escherichia coli]HCJ9344060.1 hypothetical protein [Escherichia coli]
MTEGIDQLIYNDEFPGIAYNKFTASSLEGKVETRSAGCTARVTGE